MKAINTSVCVVLLLAVGLSTQMKSEFETDFDNMVNEKALPDKKTLLDCPENCDDVLINEPACTCVYFFNCTNSPVYDCTESGLKQLNYHFEGKDASTNAVLILYRLKSLQNLNEGGEVNWQMPQSPAVFLKYIKSFFQESASQAALSNST